MRADMHAACMVVLCSVPRFAFTWHSSHSDMHGSPLTLTCGPPLQSRRRVRASHDGTSHGGPATRPPPDHRPTAARTPSDRPLGERATKMFFPKSGNGLAWCGKCRAASGECFYYASALWDPPPSLNLCLLGLKLQLCHSKRTKYLVLAT